MVFNGPVNAVVKWGTACAAGISGPLCEWKRDYILSIPLTHIAPISLKDGEGRRHSGLSAQGSRPQT